MRVSRLPLLAVLALPAALLAAVPAQADADGCATGVIQDFNGDGSADVVAADSNADVGGAVGAGRVVVQYGSGSLTGLGSTVAFAGSAPVPTQAGARFGYSLASGDMDCDGYSDLLVGAPLQDVAGATDAGAAQVLLGGAGGLGSGGRLSYTAADFGQSPATGDRFGFSVDLFEDVGQGGTPDPDAYALAIGVPYRNSAGKTDSGAVATRTALDGGSTWNWITQESPGVPGSSATGDLFGAALAYGYLNTGELVDLLVGAPGKKVGSKNDAGQVVLLSGVYGDEIISAKAYHQNSSGVPESVGTGDGFGAKISIAKHSSGYYGAIGIPKENVGDVVDAGGIQLFKNGSSGLSWQSFVSQDTSGVADKAEKGDLFGDEVGMVPGSALKIIVGVPNENVGSVVDAGMVQVVPWSSFPATASYTQDYPGITGDVGTGHHFGASVGSIDASEDVLLMGVPDDNASGMVIVFPVLSADPRAWIPSTTGLKDFGDGIASEGR